MMRMFQGRVEGGSSAISRMLAPKVGATTGGKVFGTDACVMACRNSSNLVNSISGRRPR